MPTLDIECQLVRSQISRYMSGEVFGEDSLRQLGLHIEECPGCGSFIEERRRALREMLHSDQTAEKQVLDHAVVNSSRTSRRQKVSSASSTHASDPSESSFSEELTRQEISPMSKLMQQIQERSTEQAEPAPNQALTDLGKTKKGSKFNNASFTKPAIYAGLLAVVLIGMTYFVKSPSGLLGEKASSLFPAPSTQDSKITPSATNPVRKSPEKAAGNSSVSSSGKTSGKPSGKPDFGPSVTTNIGEPTSPAAHSAPPVISKKVGKDLVKANGIKPVHKPILAPHKTHLVNHPVTRKLFKVKANRFRNTSKKSYVGKRVLLKSHRRRPGLRRSKWVSKWRKGYLKKLAQRQSLKPTQKQASGIVHVYAPGP